MTARRRIPALSAALLLAAGAARAQAASELLTRGTAAVQNLDYDSAAIFLRGALAKTGGDALPDSQRSRALMFLGATEFFRNHRDSAGAVFTRLLVANPRYRPDDLIFPPDVSSLFQDVRSGLRAVAARVPPSASISGPGDRLAIKLYATSFHEITAAVTRGTRTVRSLYRGAIGDSLEVLWDGRDSAGVVADSGAYLLRVTSRDPAGIVTHVVEVPLDVRVVKSDTLPWPPPMSDSLLLPEHQVGAGGGRSLAIGLGAAAAAALLPSVISSGNSGVGARFAVVLGGATAGLLGFRSRRAQQPIPANIASNQALRLNWQRRMDTVKAENVARRAQSRIDIRSGPPREGRP